MMVMSNVCATTTAYLDQQTRGKADNIGTLGECQRHVQLFCVDESAAYDSSVSVCRLPHLHAHSVRLTLNIMLYCSLRLLELPFFSQMIGQHTPQ